MSSRTARLAVRFLRFLPDRRPASRSVHELGPSHNVSKSVSIGRGAATLAALCRRGAAAYGVAYLLSGRRFPLQNCDFVYFGKG